LGLVATALGAGSLQGVKDFSTWKAITLIDMSATVFATFLTFVVAGWVTGKIAGFRRAEPAILHAVIGWLTAFPLFLAMLGAGIGKAFGGWYLGIAGNSSSANGAVLEIAPEALRHYATAGATAVLLGLMGAVIGGWMASGEPMSLTHHRTRNDVHIVKGG
jgi:hypothetical protein